MDELLYCCKLTDRSGTFDSAAEFLEALELDFSSWESKETGEIFHTVYSTDEAEARAAMTRIEALLPMWNDCGASISQVEFFKMKKEDWSEVWKKYFHIIHVTSRLVVKPSWLDFAPNPSQVVLEIDPGMSFGTGQHATTEYCMEVIDRLADRPDVQSFMDAGCGSGILSIAAAKLGYRPIYSFDLDPDCMAVAEENFVRNQVSEAVKLFTADAGTYQSDRKFDLVCANILGHLLIRFRHNIVQWVRPGGFLALAGILATEFDSVAAEFGELGCVELERRTKKEWTGGLFRLPE